MWQEDDRLVKALPSVFWISTTRSIRGSGPIDSITRYSKHYFSLKQPIMCDL